MTIPVVLVLAALILAGIEEIRAHGEDLIGWAVMLICVALVYGRLIL